MRKMILVAILACGGSLSVLEPVFAAPLSGGASGGGAIQGGDGAPGSGVGLPGAIVAGTTAWGIGQDDTPSVAAPWGAYRSLAPDMAMMIHVAPHRHMSRG